MVAILYKLLVLLKTGRYWWTKEQLAARDMKESPDLNQIKLEVPVPTQRQSQVCDCRG